MGEAKFTAGPWAAKQAVRVDNVGGIDWCVTQVGDTKIIAEVFQRVGGAPGFWDDRPVAANAALIAAAPDLYAALENIAWATPEKTAFSAEELIEVLRATARAALAKACPTPVVAATDNEGGEQR